MNYLYRFIVIAFVLTGLLQTANASMFSDKFIKCKPYLDDQGNRLIQVVGYMNRSCVYREITLDSTTQCVFTKKERAFINEELKLRGLKDTSLDGLQTYTKDLDDSEICSITGDGESSKSFSGFKKKK